MKINRVIKKTDRDNLLMLSKSVIKANKVIKSLNNLKKNPK
jgi:hypothetical protein